MDMDGNSPRPPPRRPEREGSYNNYDIESMDGSGAGGAPPWRQHNGSSEALLRYDDGGGADRGSAARQPLLRKRTMNTTSQIAIVGANVCPIESLDYE
jgi:chloride channel 7